MSNKIIIVLIVKLVFAGLFSSGYTKDFYGEFVNLFWEKGFEAWKLFPGGFPYTPLTVLILSIPIKAGELLKVDFIQNLLFRIPILFSDFIIFYFLERLYPKKRLEVFILYFLSPIIFLSSFIHSQIDLIPTSVAFASSFYILRNRYLKSFFLLGIAITIKWHFIILLPFYLIYYYRRVGFEISLLKYLSISILPFTLAVLPLIILHTNVFELLVAKEQSLIFKSYFTVMDLNIYFFPLVYFLILGKLVTYTRLSSDLFLGIVAIALMALTIVVYPNPGWFIWPLPYLCFCFLKISWKKHRAHFIYFSMTVTYLVFFLFFYKHPYNNYEMFLFLGKPLDIRIDNLVFSNLAFTALVTTMLLGTYVVYSSAIKNSLMYKRSFQSFLIGIAGDSGAGKTTLLNGLTSLFGEKLLTTLEGDGEHKWERGAKEWDSVTHLNPKANKLHNQLKHLIKLKRGDFTYRSNYNHKTGKFDEQKKIKGSEFVVIAGLHPFYLKGARDNIDFKIYVDTDEDLRKHWKVLRDSEKRGYSKEKVLDQIKSRQEDARKYIRPQKNFADLIVRLMPSKKIDIGVSQLKEVDIVIEYEVGIDIPLEPLIERMKNFNMNIIYHDFDEDLVRQRMRISLEEEKSSLELGEDFIHSLRIVEVFNFENIDWGKGFQGLNQVVMLYCLDKALMGVENA